MNEDPIYQCEIDEVPCLRNDYYKFDDICRRELANPITVDQIINQSDFCTSLALDMISDEQNEYLTVIDHLDGLKGKIGIYHLWIEIGYCQDHNKHSMLCVYVGKGIALNRVLCHIKEKWPEQHMLYVTFFECANRMAKYLEQLFLDTYNFYLNKDENSGSGSLYARWDEQRFDLGTELSRMADIYSRKLDTDP